jgi:hypothetical protein
MAFPNKIPKEPPAVTAVFDNGRRGKPLIGCDCAQCFGYCILSPEVRERELRSSLEAAVNNAAA